MNAPISIFNDLVHATTYRFPPQIFMHHIMILHHVSTNFHLGHSLKSIPCPTLSTTTPKKQATCCPRRFYIWNKKVSYECECEMSSWWGAHLEEGLPLPKFWAMSVGGWKRASVSRAGGGQRSRIVWETDRQTDIFTYRERERERMLRGSRWM